MELNGKEICPACKENEDMSYDGYCFECWEELLELFGEEI